MEVMRCWRLAIFTSLVCNVHSSLATEWTLTNDNSSIEVRGTVPGGVYSDLLNASILHDGDFYYRFNDVYYRWVALNNWAYSTTFDVDPDLMAHERVVLIFDGVDTAADVVLNGDVIGTTSNMFVRYVFDVKSHLQSVTEATLDVKFESPVAYAKRIYEKQLEDYLVPPKCVPREYQGECHANHIRKMQASFAWDWGPAFPNMGIWKPWHLVGFDSLLVSAILFSATPTSTLPNEPDSNFKPGWNVTVQVVFDAAISSGTVAGSLNITLGNVYSLKNSTKVTVQDFQGTATSTFHIEKGAVDMWWPNGYGPQPLYALSAIWSDGTVEKAKTVRVGFRTVELNQDFVKPDNESLGRYFRVHVNNVTMFMKGSNWIPAHVLPEMVSEQYIKELLQAAKLTHQNCIRVWGGGIYESDVFYETADELGILIWEDFMFACSMYPVSQPFLDSVAEEVKTQVRRLQHHPSILLWAANNENEIGLRGNVYGTESDFDKYKSDYITLYVNTIRNVTEGLDSTRPFVVSSPSNGIESEEEEGYIAQNPNSNLYGDVHYYNYLSDAWNWKLYPSTRFTSEYGFQSWPFFSSMKYVTDEHDWHSTSAMSYHRQHHPDGQAELSIQIGLHMFLPPEDGSPESYEHYLYLSQIHQAVAIKTETEFYRRGMSSINDKGEGYSSGALYWQLNDIWQGASWASIEYGGRWKMLHYFAMKFFSPILVSLYLDADNLEVAIVSDSYKALMDLRLTIDLYRYDQKEAVARFEKHVDAAPSEANIVAQYNLWDDLELKTHCQEGLYDEVDVCFVVSRLLDSNGTRIAPDNYLFFGEPKDANMPMATLELVSISEPVETARSNWTFTVKITSDAVALFVWLEADEAGVFSDNGFLMLNEVVEIEFYASQKTTVDSLQKSLTVKSLTDTYTEETVAKARAMAVILRASHDRITMT